MNPISRGVLNYNGLICTSCVGLQIIFNTPTFREVIMSKLSTFDPLRKFITEMDSKKGSLSNPINPQFILQYLGLDKSRQLCEFLVGINTHIYSKLNNDFKDKFFDDVLVKVYYDIKHCSSCGKIYDEKKEPEICSVLTLNLLAWYTKMYDLNVGKFKTENKGTTITFNGFHLAFGLNLQFPLIKETTSKNICSGCNKEHTLVEIRGRISLPKLLIIELPVFDTQKNDRYPNFEYHNELYIILPNNNDTPYLETKYELIGEVIFEGKYKTGGTDSHSTGYMKDLNGKGLFVDNENLKKEDVINFKLGKFNDYITSANKKNYATQYILYEKKDSSAQQKAAQDPPQNEPERDSKEMPCNEKTKRFQSKIPVLKKPVREKAQKTGDKKKEKKHEDKGQEKKEKIGKK